MLCALHLFDTRLCLAHGNLSRIVGQLIDVEERALHLLGGIALEHMYRNPASFSIHNRRAALFELIANCDHGVGIIGGSRRGCWESEFANRRLQLLTRDPMRQDAQLRKLVDFTLIIIGVWCLIPLRWNQCATYCSSDRFVIHVGDSRRHGVAAPASLWAPASATNRVAFERSNHWRGCAARNGLNVARLLAVSSPAATSLIATIPSIISTAAAIITWSQATKSTRLTLRRLARSNARM